MSEKTPPCAAPVWQVYVLVCADGSLYCGVSTDVERRVRQHNGLLPGGAKYTRGRGPVSLLAAVACPDQPTALRLEAAVKKARGRERKLRVLHEGRAQGGFARQERELGA